MEILREDFKKIGFKDGYDLGLMNLRHVLIRFELEEDYQRCWITSLWNIGGFQMRILKWQSGFKFEEDPPIIPIWVSLHELPLEWTHPTVLYSIASTIGKPLQVDTPTLNLTRPSVARLCVERAAKLDIKKWTVGKEKQKKVTWGSKKKGKKDELQVTIIQENPLILKCVETAVEKSQLAGILKPAETLISKPAETHAGESTSGLSALEKSPIPVDIIDSQPLYSGCYKVGDVDGSKKEVIAQGDDGFSLQSTQLDQDLSANEVQLNIEAPIIQSNKFALLEALDDDGVAAKTLDNEEDEVEEEIVYTEANHHAQVVQDDQTKTNNQDEGFAKLAYPDDSLVKDLNETDDDDIAQGDCWSEGNKDEAVFGGKVQGVFSTKKKRGRKLKEERARLLDGQEGGTHATGWVSKKLDRILFSQEWMEIFPCVSIELLSRTTSDHSPLLFQFDTQLETRPRCFRFQKMWLRRVDFKNIVKASWLQPANSFGMMAFLMKLRRLKLVLKEWNKTHFGDVFENLRNAEERVKELEVPYDHSGHANDRQNLHSARAFLLQKLKEHEDFWRQKMRLTWLKEGIPPPVSVLKEMERKCQRFLWHGGNEEKRRHWRAWDRLTFPTSENGLGLRKFDDVLSTFSSLKALIKIIPSFILWEIWKMRNKMLFDVEKFNREKVILATKVTIRNVFMTHDLKARNVEERNWIENNFGFQLQKVRMRTCMGVSWKASEGSDYVLNTNGSLINSDSGYGFCIRKWNGSFVYGESGYLGGGDSFDAEVHGVLFGVRKCCQLGLEKVDIQTDNKGLASLLLSMKNVP
ncbi:OLC1v1001377C1 [Oldenlandia corymbosa var. corymbosa]|uniref:OLC1v1001377C1 n=1 Tax=Oldenlandia corymbosa var. corymbosa TaxID=529605 RepID=A0AAV1D515_OLDCO|nr:OLC1v1001377C1 [Oldenlandia corymbosa var. corymbosa]